MKYGVCRFGVVARIKVCATFRHASARIGHSVTNLQVGSQHRAAYSAVDSHRTAGLVISPYVKRGVEDSTMYSTVSMLRTVELLLGVPPMTQHDAAAPPMVNSFMSTPDLSASRRFRRASTS